MRKFIADIIAWSIVLPVIFCVAMSLALVVAGCGSSMPSTVRDARSAAPKAEGRPVSDMSSVCEHASLRERLGGIGVRTAEGTFYCGT
jgi:hypothetical protein